MVLFQKFTLKVTVIILLHSQFLDAIECPTENNKKCEDFWHELFKYPGHNLREGLKCLNYNGNITSLQASGNKSSLQYIHFETIAMDITDIDEVKKHVLWDWKYKTSWVDERLKWPKECLIENQTTTDFVKSELLDVLWNPLEFLKDSDEGAGKLVCKNTLQITQVLLHFQQTHCILPLNVSIKDVELSWYILSWASIDLCLLNKYYLGVYKMGVL